MDHPSLGGSLACSPMHDTCSQRASVQYMEPCHAPRGCPGPQRAARLCYGAAAKPQGAPGLGPSILQLDGFLDGHRLPGARERDLVLRALQRVLLKAVLRGGRHMRSGLGPRLPTSSVAFAAPPIGQALPGPRSALQGLRGGLALCALPASSCTQSRRPARPARVQTGRRQTVACAVSAGWRHHAGDGQKGERLVQTYGRCNKDAQAPALLVPLAPLVTKHCPWQHSGPHSAPLRRGDRGDLNAHLRLAIAAAPQARGASSPPAPSAGARSGPEGPAEGCAISGQTSAWTVDCDAEVRPQHGLVLLGTPAAPLV